MSNVVWKASFNNGVSSFKAARHEDALKHFTKVFFFTLVGHFTPVSDLRTRHSNRAEISSTSFMTLAQLSMRS
jgi:hypothetical protein